MLRLTLYALLPAFLIAQAPDTLWTKTYGDWHDDAGYSIDQTTDGGYIVTGYTFIVQKDVDDLWLLKTDSLGDTLWTKTYGGDEDDYDGKGQQTADGGYVVAGFTQSYGAGSSDFWLIKTDSLGDTLWTRTYGGVSDEYFQSVKQTTDHGYILGGGTISYGPGGVVPYLVKTDSLGDTLWTKICAEYWGIVWSVIQTSDNGYAFTGDDRARLYIEKTDSLGNQQWAQCYAGTSYDYGYDIQETVDHGYIIVGYTSSFGAGKGDVWLLRTNSLGDTLWTRTYGGPEHDWGRSIALTVDGGYIITGYTESFGAGASDVYVIKTDSLGEERWSMTCGGIAGDEGREIQQTPDQGYIIAGTTSSFGAGGRDVYLIRIAPDTMGVAEQHCVPAEKKSPGPSILTGPLQLPNDKPYKIFDITGRQIYTLNPAPGIYFIQLDDIITQKVIKIK